MTKDQRKEEKMQYIREAKKVKKIKGILELIYFPRAASSKLLPTYIRTPVGLICAVFSTLLIFLLF
jgi:hypothetical protein